MIFSCECTVTDAGLSSGGAAGDFEELEGVFACGVEGEGVWSLGSGGGGAIFLCVGSLLVMLARGRRGRWWFRGRGRVGRGSVRWWGM